MLLIFGLETRVESEKTLCRKVKCLACRELTVASKSTIGEDNWQLFVDRLRREKYEVRKRHKKRRRRRRGRKETELSKRVTFNLV